MSLGNPCDCSCPTPELVNTPGSPGDPGEPGQNGADGVSAFTLTSADFVIPAINANVSVPDGFIHLAVSAWMAVGQPIFVSDETNWGTFEVVSIPGATTVVAKFLGHTGDSAPGLTIASGAKVSPGGTQPPLSAALPTAVNYAALTAAGAVDTLAVAAGVGVFTLVIPITLVQITGAADVLTTYTPGYKFQILSVNAFVVDVVTTAAKAVTLNLEINATNLTGGVVALTSANCTPLGAQIVGSAVTAANTGSATDTISIEASAVTAFAEGRVVLLIKIQNMDTADAIASMADHINDLITALT